MHQIWFSVVHQNFFGLCLAFMCVNLDKLYAFSSHEMIELQSSSREDLNITAADYQVWHLPRVNKPCVSNTKVQSSVLSD